MRVVLAFVISVFLYAAPARAQGNPRDFDRPGPAAERAMYYAQVRFEVNQVLIRWQRAWEEDDAATLAKLYAEEASYLPSGLAPAQTRPAIRDHFSTFLRAVGGVQVQMIDFGTSGDLAYVTGRVSYQNQSGNSQQSVRTDLLVLRRRLNGDWQIHTHLTRDEPAAPLSPSGSYLSPQRE